MTVLAICEAPDPDLGGALLILFALGLLYVLPVSATFVTAASGTRLQLAGIFATAVGISVLFGWVIPGGLSNTGSNFLALFFGGVGVGGLLGFSVALVRPTGDVWRQVLLGLLGGATFLVWAVALFFFVLTSQGICLD